LWKYEQPAAFMPVLSTGGGLTFVGHVNRRFRAFDAATGEVLWETILGSAVSGHPVTYEVDGVQHVAVSAADGIAIEGTYLAAATGEVLWETVLGSVAAGPPVTYEVDGVQYVAVSAGGGIGIEGTYLAAAGLTAPSGGNMIYVFKLP